jgi:glycosyltransferase involved in cell wall biosynthesis
MACGAPVILSNASSLPEVAAESALLIPPYEIEAWVNALRRAYQDSDWRESARGNGLQHARQFSWRATAERTLNSYKQAFRDHS